MFRKEVNPKTAFLATVVILVVVQFFYWKGLVYREPPVAGPAGGGGGGAAMTQQVMGRQDVLIETVTGAEPGFQDGALREARFAGPNAVALAEDGTLYVSDSRNHRIRRVNRGGAVTTFAGGGPAGGRGERADGPAPEARFSFPSGVAEARDGAVYVADTGNHRICRIAGGRVTTLAGGSAGRADGPGRSARFRHPGPLTVGPDGAVWVSDLGNRTIRRISPDGQVTTPPSIPAEVSVALGDLHGPPVELGIESSANGTDAPALGPFKTRRRSPGGTLPGTGLRLFADPAGATLHSWPVGAGATMLLAGRRESADRQSAGTTDGEGSHALFTSPCSVAVAPGGVLYVADYGGNRIRKATLPAWLIAGEAVPVRRRRLFRGRGMSGN